MSELYCPQCAVWVEVDVEHLRIDQLPPHCPDCDAVLACQEPVVCRVCGCSDAHACGGGCWWVEAGLCSACATPAQRDAAQREALAELFLLTDPSAAVPVEMAPAQLFLLVSACQLSTTHPGVDGEMRAMLRDLGRQMQRIFDGGAIGELLERGWHRDQDVDIAARQIFLPDGSTVSVPAAPPATALPSGTRGDTR